MGILDKLGIKKKKAEASPKQESSLPIHGLAAAQEGKPINRQTTKAYSGNAYQILLRPILSEKSTHLAASGKYVFAVNPRANKSEIKKSIERVYEVHVEEVKVINLRGKRRRYGRTRGITSARKKAIVTVRSGEKIPGIIEAVG